MPTSMISDVYDGSDRSHHAWTNNSIRITRIDFQYGSMFLKILLIFFPFFFPVYQLAGTLILSFSGFNFFFCNLIDTIQISNQLIYILFL